jgi:hypothetical protein
MSDEKETAAAATVRPSRDSGSGAPVAPRHPERICWGCDKYCPEDDLACGNGTIRTPHPIELFGSDWLEWSEGTSGVRNSSRSN